MRSLVCSVIGHLSAFVLFALPLIERCVRAVELSFTSGNVIIDKWNGRRQNDNSNRYIKISPNTSVRLSHFFRLTNHLYHNIRSNIIRKHNNKKSFDRRRRQNCILCALIYFSCDIFYFCYCFCSCFFVAFKTNGNMADMCYNNVGIKYIAGTIILKWDQQ